MGPISYRRLLCSIYSLSVLIAKAGVDVLDWSFLRFFPAPALFLFLLNPVFFEFDGIVILLFSNIYCTIVDRVFQWLGSAPVSRSDPGLSAVPRGAQKPFLRCEAPGIPHTGYNFVEITEVMWYLITF